MGGPPPKSFPPPPAADRSACRDRGRLCRTWLCSRCTFLLRNRTLTAWTPAAGPSNASYRRRFRDRNPLFCRTLATMDDWIDYYDSTHTIYVSKRHRDLPFQVIARDIIGYISYPAPVLLAYARREPLSPAQLTQ